MTLWNLFSDYFISIKNTITNFYEYIKNYLYGYNDIWFFILGHTAPISLNNITNDVHSNWIYDNDDKSLYICASENTELNNYKFSWLSVKIKIFTSENKSFEYNIDNFIENFNLITFDNIVPSLYMIYMCWCINTKQWFNADYTVKFYIIDNMGEEHIIDIEEHNDSLCIKQNKIYVVIHNEDKSNDEVIDLEESNKEELFLIKENETKED